MKRLRNLVGKIIRKMPDPVKKLTGMADTLDKAYGNTVQKRAMRTDRARNLVRDLKGQQYATKNYWKGALDKAYPDADDETKKTYMGRLMQGNVEYQRVAKHIRAIKSGKGYLGAQTTKKGRQDTIRMRELSKEVDRRLQTTRAPKIGGVDLGAPWNNVPLGSSGMFKDNEISPHDVDHPEYPKGHPNAQPDPSKYPNPAKRGLKRTMTKEGQELRQYIDDMIKEGFSDAEIAYMIQMDEGLKNTLRAAGRAGMTFAGLASAGAAVGLGTTATMGMAGVDPKVAIGTGAAITAAGLVGAAREAKHEFNYRTNDELDKLDLGKLQRDATKEPAKPVAKSVRRVVSKLSHKAAVTRTVNSLKPKAGNAGPWSESVSTYRDLKKWENSEETPKEKKNAVRLMQMDREDGHGANHSKWAKGIVNQGLRKARALGLRKK